MIRTVPKPCPQVYNESSSLSALGALVKTQMDTLPQSHHRLTFSKSVSGFKAEMGKLHEKIRDWEMELKGIDMEAEDIAHKLGCPLYM